MEKNGLKLENEGAGREQKLIDAYSLLIIIFLYIILNSELKFKGQGSKVNGTWQD